MSWLPAPKEPSVDGPVDAPQGESPKPEPGSEGPITRMAGSRAPADETFVDLYEHNIRLQALTRWDWAAPVLGCGTLLFGAGMGAWAAGAALESRGVLLCGIVGAVLLVMGVILKDDRSKAVRDVAEEFDRRLCLYEDEPMAAALRRKLNSRAKQQEKEHTVPAKLRRLRARILGDGT